MQPKNQYAGLRRSIPRRRFLRGVGVALGLPFLDAMYPAFAQKSNPADTPRRMLAICNNLGFLAGGFFPKQAGKDYELSSYLSDLKPFRDDFTVFSGVWHPDVDGGHSGGHLLPHRGAASRAAAASAIRFRSTSSWRNASVT